MQCFAGKVQLFGRGLGAPAAFSPAPVPNRTLSVVIFSMLVCFAVNYSFICLISPGQLGGFRSNACSQPESEHGSEQTRERAAWNKGKTVPEEIRTKVSEGMRRKWKDPEYRNAVSSSLQGREAWNKGKSLSDETRRKMSEAKLNHVVSKDTRRKMSESHKGKTLDPKSAALVSEKLKGVPKSEEHKSKIAAAMRKRHAAIRVLNAVESVYDQESSDEVDSSTLSNISKRQISSVRRQATSQILGEFKAELREYRSLQDELSPWSEAFVNRHGRKPTMSDVERTGITWLVSRYKRYVLLRERLFTETHLLRRKLDNAANPSTNGVGAPAAEKQNANRKSLVEMSEQASRFQAAARYKLKKAAQTDRADGSSSADDSADDLTSYQMHGLGSNTPSRVREALQSAIAYRKQKAQETKSAALEAARKAAEKQADGQ